LKISKNKSNTQNYLTATPHPGAGIGHQLANWIAGFWFAKQFQLKFAHSPFSTIKWETFLGFGSHEKKVSELKSEGYKIVKIPLFDENKHNEITVIQNIMNSYQANNVVFVCEQDQFYRDQYGVIDSIQQKFHNSPERAQEELRYSAKNYNIAIHVRRGDIVIGQKNNNPNLQMRWQNNDYFETVLKEVVTNTQTNKPIAIYLFSQGENKDFETFNKFKNLNFCLDMDAQSTFLHMVMADLLITSKSSFSYKPALLNNGIKVVPTNFWHGYPKTNDWIQVDENGFIEEEQKINFLKE
jgi:hypothetical protein